MLWLCDAAHVPVIWATEVLDHLIAEGASSRAEATDAAMSQRAGCVMLNKGPFLPEGVAFLGTGWQRMERHQSKKFARLGPLKSWTRLAIEDGGASGAVKGAGEVVPQRPGGQDEVQRGP